MIYTDIGHHSSNPDDVIIWYRNTLEKLEFRTDIDGHGDVYDEIDTDFYIFGRIDMRNKIGSISCDDINSWKEISLFKKCVNELVSRCPNVLFYCFIGDNPVVSIAETYRRLNA